MNPLLRILSFALAATYTCNRASRCVVRTASTGKR
jgi:hypothetical protein